MSLLDARSDAITVHSPPSALLESVAALTPLVDRDSRPEQVVRTVRDWGQRLCGRIAPDASVLNRLRMLNFFFFEELGFHGESSSGDWADAGSLHRVIERRSGIAPSLSILYMEIGRAIGLKLVALEFADSFLVKLVCTGRVLVIDVSDRGATLSEQQLRSRLASSHREQESSGEGYGALQRLLRGVPEVDIPVRILRALRQRHQAADQWAEALAVQSQLVQLRPDDRQELLGRASLYERLGCPRAAASDLQTCLRLNPDAPDADSIRRRCLQLQQQARRLN
jgi:regulator of sirC expression with transglutaminase-like and TPR domain